MHEAKKPSGITQEYYYHTHCMYINEKEGRVFWEWNYKNSQDTMMRNISNRYKTHSMLATLLLKVVLVVMISIPAAATTTTAGNWTPKHLKQHHQRQRRHQKAGKGKGNTPSPTRGPTMDDPCVDVVEDKWYTWMMKL